MKKIIYSLLASMLGILSFISCSDSGDSNIIRLSRLDYSDIRFWVGSPSGGIELTDLQTVFSTPKHVVTDLDSLKRQLLTKHFSIQYLGYNSNFSNITFEFIEGSELLAYNNANSNANNQIISTYFFRNDSLFINVLGSDPKFLAEGSSDAELRRMGTFMKYPATAVADWQVESDTTTLFDIDDAVAKSYFGSLAAMTNPLDTIIVSNVAYIYK